MAYDARHMRERDITHRSLENKRDYDLLTMASPTYRIPGSIDYVGDTCSKRCRLLCLRWNG